MKTMADELELAERVTALHEEALCSIDEYDTGYDALRAATARQVLVECNLRDVIDQVEAEVTAAPAPERAPRPCNHLVYRDGRCVGCGAQGGPVSLSSREPLVLRGDCNVVPLRERKGAMSYTVRPLVETMGSGHDALSMLIDPTERARRVTKKAAAEAKQHQDPEIADVELTSIRDGWVGTAAPEELCLYLGEVAHSLFTRTEGAINYVEWEIHTSADDRYVLSVAKSKDRTPGSLLAEAKHRIAELEAQVANLRADVVRHGGRPSS